MKTAADALLEIFSRNFSKRFEVRMEQMTPNARSASALDLAQVRDKVIREFGSSWSEQSGLAPNPIQFKSLPGRRVSTGLRLSRSAQ